MKYDELAILKTGAYFGEAALIENKSRMASIRCLEDSHFAILSKEDFNRALGAIEKRKYNERIQFLQSLPFFDKLTKNSVGKLSYQFIDVPTIKGQVLYKEGDPSEYVYLVKEGLFEVTRTLTFKEDPSEKTKKIFVNPMKANRVSGCSQLSNIKRLKST